MDVTGIIGPTPLVVAASTPSVSPPKLGMPSPTPASLPTTPMFYKMPEKPIYSSPPPASNCPENNKCRLIDYRDAKIAAFNVDGCELICLPQAFDLFLKHLVGGLHTVYTKLKRLDISPIVCNVEQVRVLRGLGAIQPGVNRCKLLSCKEFDVLYEDCTNSSARPGRPPKRSSAIQANPDTREKLKKNRLDNGDYGYNPRSLFEGYNPFVDPKKSPLLGNGYHYPPHLASLGFMPLGHPMMSPAVSMAMASHLGLRPDGTMLRDQCGSDTDMVSPRSKDDRSEDDHSAEDNNNKPFNRHNVFDHNRGVRRSSTIDKESGVCTSSELTNERLDLSKLSVMHSGHDDMDAEDDDLDDDKDDEEESENVPPSVPNRERAETATRQHMAFAQHLLSTETSGISSVETLLMNIQGLLKVTAENARHHERQISFEKAELKMEAVRERELRENIQKQVMEEQRLIAIIQKRLKKEKKSRRKLVEQAENDRKRYSTQTDESLVQEINQSSIRQDLQRQQQDTSIRQDSVRQDGMRQEALRHDSFRQQEAIMRHAAPDNLRMINGRSAESGTPETDMDKNIRSDNERKIQGTCGGIQNIMESFLAQSSRNGANGYLYNPPMVKPESI